MEKLDKVIAALECCRVNEDEPCDGNCPYTAEQNCVEKLMDDALACLKELSGKYRAALEVAAIATEKLAARPVITGEWEVVHGVLTPGGDPLLRCPYCRSRESEHLCGIECIIEWDFCPKCGAELTRR